LSRVFHLPVLTRGVSRIKPTLPQTGLSMRERRRNVQGAFQVEDRKSVYRRDILIVDDVLTSRATVASLAQTLKRAGCGRVLVLALASGK
jgi:predicted amidophosphoribosyltransferase